MGKIVEVEALFTDKSIGVNTSDLHRLCEADRFIYTPIRVF